MATLLTICGGAAGSARADSSRCAGATLAPDNATSAEAQMIAARLLQLTGPNVAPGEGPLGCPLPTPAPGAGPQWRPEWATPHWAPKWAAQRFQRGWILINKNPQRVRPNTLHLPDWVVAVRGERQWFVWWHGRTTVAVLTSSDGKQQLWHAGTPVDNNQESWTTFPAGASVAIYACGAATSCEMPPSGFNSLPIASWFSQVTPELVVPPGTGAVDFASRLTMAQLKESDPGAFALRRDAGIAPWLPCHTADPTRDLDSVSAGIPDIQGEAQLSQALLMLRRSAACPVTGRSPAGEIASWLSKANLKAGQVPGSTSDAWPCRRDGEFDVTAAGLLHVIFGYGFSAPSSPSLSPPLSAAVRERLVGLLKPWGGRPRSGPYVEPGGACAGLLLESENHILLQETDRYLINHLVAASDPDPVYSAASNGTREWLVDFLRLQLRRDFYEYNAIPYGRYELKALWLLHDYAPDLTVRQAAEGVLDWLFAKHALSANLLRESRPFRRLPESGFYNTAPWYGSASDAITVAAALLAGGGLQYLSDPANLNDAAALTTLANLNEFAGLGSMDDGHLPELADVADTTYRLPDAIASWYQKRYGAGGQGQFYLQAIHHLEKAGQPLDPNKFKQWNGGAELYSGHRNWTITAGGIDTPPADPGNPEGTWKAMAGASAVAGVVGSGLGLVAAGLPGAVVGGVIGLVAGALTAAEIVSSVQETALWKTQAALMRPTTLVPTAAGLDRSQSIRFGSPYVAQRDARLAARMCVADGFMCGFDLRWPPNTFPDNACPDKRPISLPASAQKLFEDHQQRGHFGCLLEPARPYHDWTIWTFDRGQIAVRSNAPAAQAPYEFAWVETPSPREPGARTVHVEWNLQGDAHDWFVVHGVATGGGADNDQARNSLSVVGDPNDTGRSAVGGVAVPLAAGNTTTAWDTHVEGCDPTYFVVRTGHRCNGDLLPDLHLNVAARPAEPFSCAGHFVDDAGGSVGLMVGGKDCGQQYGMYLYVYNHGCGPGDECPPGAQSFGFVIASPSDDWTYPQFEAQVRRVVAQQSFNSVTTSPMEVLVPETASRAHTVRFRWHLPAPTDWAITDESGPAQATMKRLGTHVDDWSLAVGHAYDVNSLVPSPLLDAPGNDGCFTITGTVDAPEPRTLVVDLRGAPRGRQLINSAAAGAACR